MRKPLDLKATLNLPETAFPMKANLPANEPKWLERWRQERLYQRIRESRERAPIFTLHDGPPYANGRLHLGTALTKILKDMVVKSKTLAGFNAPFVPGWDCHGLPIEINVDKELGAAKSGMPVVEVRRGEGFVVTAGEGALLVTEVQPEGRRRMTADEYARGARLEVGEQLGEAANSEPPVANPSDADR